MRRSLLAGLPPLLLLAALGCDPAGPGADASMDANCRLDVSLGRSGAGGFVPLAEGEGVELILGFQGFRMLQFDVLISGASAAESEFNSYLFIESSGIELSQRTRESYFDTVNDREFVVRNYLLFFNDQPSSLVVDRAAEIELVVRTGACVGGTRRGLLLRDEDSCVDFDAAVPEAGILDGGVPDGAVACAP